VSIYKGDYPIALGGELSNIKIDVESNDTAYYLNKQLYYLLYEERGKEGEKIVVKGLPKST